MLDSPQVECGESDFIDKRDGKTIKAEIDGFEIASAGVAGFHADVFAFVGGEVRKFFFVEFATVRAEHAAELPFTQAERTEQRTASAFAFRTKNDELRKRSADGADASRLVGGLWVVRLKMLGKRLERRAKEEIVDG